MAVTGSAYRDTMVVAAPPVWVQRAMFATLAPVGRLLGLQASYPQYVQSSMTVDPHPDALAALGAAGRLAWDAGSSDAPTAAGAR